MSESDTKTGYLNLLNVISMFAVVMLHVNGCFWSYSPENWWLEANIIESVMYFGVPIFFMISGATLLDYRERYDTKQFFKKRVIKTFIPFIFWSLFGVVFNVLLGRIDVSNVSLDYVVDGICNTTIVSVYWFFIPLFSVYMSMPLFAAVIKEKKIHIFKYIVIIAFVLNSLIPFMAYFFKWIPYNSSIRIDVGAKYIMYILLGYILHNCDIKPVLRPLVYILGVIGLLIHAVGTYKLSIRDGCVNRDFKGYTSVQCIMYSVAIFVLIKYLCSHLQYKWINRIVNFIKRYTFGIYLLHWFVMTALNHLYDFDIYSLKYRLIMPFVIIAICIVIIEILRKVPIIKHVVP